VDPLDGTTNFLHRIPVFAVSIGILKDGKLVFGVVHAPALGETWQAAAGGGAFCNDRPIAVSTTSTLSESLLATGFPVSRRGEALDGVLLTLRRALSACQDLHRHGCASLDLCSVAAGRLDGYWEPGLHPWDLAAGVRIVSEAGGRVTDLDGNPFDLGSGRVLATNGRIHDDLARVIAGG
jgi:myo-inositol-1(or 4)-monophosphatase